MLQKKKRKLRSQHCPIPGHMRQACYESYCIRSSSKLGLGRTCWNDVSKKKLFNLYPKIHKRLRTKHS